MLITNLRHNQDQLRAFKYISDIFNEDRFGFIFAGVRISMPPTYIVSNDFIRRGEDDKMASLLKSSLVIRHPAPDHASPEAKTTNLYELQRFYYNRHSVAKAKMPMLLPRPEDDIQEEVEEYDQTLMVFLNQAYLKAYNDFDTDEEMNRTVTVDIWKKEEEDTLNLSPFLFSY